MTDALFGPAAIINRVIWLHRGDNFIASETRDVLRSQMLCMFDAKAPIAIAAFPFYALVNRKNVVVGTIADGVNDYLQTCAIGAAHAFEHRPFGKHFVAGNAAGVRRVEIRFEEERGS